MLSNLLALLFLLKFVKKNLLFVPGFDSFIESDQKTFKNWYSQLSCLTFWVPGEALSPARDLMVNLLVVGRTGFDYFVESAKILKV